MSPVIRQHHHHHGTCGCILPNCAFVVKPACPSCGHVQETSVASSGSVVDSQAVPVPPSEDGEATREGVHGATKDAVVQSPLTKAYLESDVGHGFVQCEIPQCGEVYRVFINITLTAQALGKVAPPANKS